jgi:hypothetical protein
MGETEGLFFRQTLNEKVEELRTISEKFSGIGAGSTTYRITLCLTHNICSYSLAKFDTMVDESYRRAGGLWIPFYKIAKAILWLDLLFKSVYQRLCNFV